MNIGITLIGQMITFILFVWFTKAYVWPPLTKALKDRQEKVAKGLAAAEKGHKQLELAQEKALKRIAETKEEAVQIIEQAKKRASLIVDEAKEEARIESKKIVAKAQKDVEQRISIVKDELREQVSKVIILGAEKVIAKSIDEKAHQDIISQMIKEL